MIGRAEHRRQLEDILKSNRAHFVAVTGRRRVGKTHLIEQMFGQAICFRLTGIQSGSLEVQLRNFGQKLAEHAQMPLIPNFYNWQEALVGLKVYLSGRPNSQKQVIFIDELPWVVTPKSGFLELLAHLWNDYLSKENHFILVICGSASSWITQKILRNKGGLHNRLTAMITLEPFNLKETEEFLNAKGLHFTRTSLVQLYMVMGGIPYYLEHVRKGESVAAVIDRLCFSEGGLLISEYQNLYKALFKPANDHEAVVDVLAKSRNGLTREELILQSGVKSGGPYQRVMEDLLLTGFVREEIPFGRKKRGSVYRLADEYSLFYHRFIKLYRKNTPKQWLQLAVAQSYKIWSGYAFENLCLKNVPRIKAALGIRGVYTEASNLYVVGNENTQGFQIDLLIDRKDDAINLVEIKYYSGPFSIDKKYAEELRQKIAAFRTYTGTRKQIFLTMLTNEKILENAYSRELVDAQLTLEDLF